MFLNKLKPIFLFLLFLVLFIVPSIFAPFDASFYDQLTKPNITPPSFLFGIVWTVLYMLISLSATLTLTTKTDEKKTCLLILLGLTYLFIQLYSYLQFGIQNLSLALIDVLLVLLTSLLLYYSTKTINKTASYLLIPLILWVIFASFLQVGIVRLN